MRKTAAIIATTGLVAILTACSPAGEPSADCEPSATNGSSSSTVTAPGEFDAVPEGIDFPTPLKPAETERNVLIEGDGDRAMVGQKVTLEVNIFNGTTGNEIGFSGYNEESAESLLLGEGLLPGLVKGLECTKAGSRVAIVAPAKDGLGPNGGNAAIGVGKDDTLVFVIDVTKVYPARANGADQPAQAGMPSVVLAPDGTPGITIPSADAPTELKIADLKKGDGPVVKAGDSVTVQYTGVLWDTGMVFDSSWQNGAPVSFTTDGVVPGFSAALVGHTVGSQVLAVVPPAEGYGDQANGAIPASSTLVFVVDILGID